MNNLKAITIITVFLIGMSATSLLAQGNQTRTSSAKAVYGYPGEYKTKKKKKKQSKAPKRKAKSKGKAPLYRKKNPWVN